MTDINIPAVPACEADHCSECAHEPHQTGDCDAAVYDRDDLLSKCRCEGGA